MNRLTALDTVRAKWGPTAYAQYIWIGDGRHPLCQVSYGEGESERLFTAETFESALHQADPRQRWTTNPPPPLGPTRCAKCGYFDSSIEHVCLDVPVVRRRDGARL